MRPLIFRLVMSAPVLTVAPPGSATHITTHFNAALLAGRIGPSGFLFLCGLFLDFFTRLYDRLMQRTFRSEGSGALAGA